MYSNGNSQNPFRIQGSFDLTIFFLVLLKNNRIFDVQLDIAHMAFTRENGSVEKYILIGVRMT